MTGETQDVARHVLRGWRWVDGGWRRVEEPLGLHPDDPMPDPFEPMGAPLHPITGEPA